jgi:arylsulfatase A-like enzyme
MKKLVIMLAIVVWLAKAAAAAQPNIIFILCDDLGYGDVGVLFQNGRAVGLPKHATPQLDKLAAEGLQLRRHYCPAPMCAPSRASLLTGVHQGHATVRNYMPSGALEDTHTVGTVLKKAGYATAVIGKWGLAGAADGTNPATWPGYPTKRGFDYFLGYPLHSAHEHYPKEGLSSGPEEVWENDTEISGTLDKCYTTDLFAARAKKWIVDHRAASPDQPFFLYLAFDAPHTPHQLPTQAYPAGGGLTGGLQWTGTPGAMINTASGTVNSYVHPDYANATYDHDNNPATPEVAWVNTPAEPAMAHATSIRRIDEAVGDLAKLLQDLQIETNTLVIFTSDNGPATPCDFFDSFGPFDGTKFDCWEGGLREPMFVRWPGTVASNRISHAASQFHDWLPTFAELAGLPAPAHTDGVSLVPTLKGAGMQRPSTIYVEYQGGMGGATTPDYPEFDPAHRNRVREEMQMVYVGDYVGVRYNILSHADNFEIHNTLIDPQETNNLASSLPEVQQQMKDRVLQLRRPGTHATPYDNELVPPANLVTATTQGLEHRAYEGMYPWVPDCVTLTPVARGASAGIDLAVRTRDINIGLLFTGYLSVPVDGDYTFYLAADSRAFLRLHEAVVIDADYGYTGGTEISAVMKLKAGLHPLRLAYARGAGGVPGLALKWSGPGLAKQAIPNSAFLRDETGAPTLSNIPDQFVGAGTAAADILFFVGDTETPAGSLAVTATSLNTVLVPAANIVLGGSGTDRTLTVTPAVNQGGSATIVVTVSDGVLAATDTFILTVTEGTGAAATVVDWGGNYVSVAQNFGRTAVSESPAANYGGLTNTDARKSVPFSDSALPSERLSPLAGYGGSSSNFYGGWTSIVYDPPVGGPTPNSSLRIFDNAANDFIQFVAGKGSAWTGEAAAVALWMKPDFLAGAGEPLCLTATCTQRINIATGGLGAYRLVVKNGPQYYVSETSKADAGWLTVTNPATEKWATFNPATGNGRLNDIGVSYTARTFDDVEGVGYFWSCPSGTVRSTTVNLRIQDVELMAAAFMVRPPSMLDLDTDGMDDTWEIAHFGATNAANGGADADWDGDGLVNHAEFIAGTSPTNRASLFGVTQIMAPESGRFALAWDSITGRYYTIETGAALHPSAWSNCVGGVHLPGVGGRMTWTSAPPDEVNSFFRLRAIWP